MRYSVSLENVALDSKVDKIFDCFALDGEKKLPLLGPTV
jgi:hypothetical protein